MSRIDASLAIQVANAQKKDWLTVLIRVKEPQWPGLAAQMGLLEEGGLIQDETEAQFWETELAIEREKRVKAAQKPVAAAIKAVGGKVKHEYSALFGLDALLTPEMIDELSTNEDIVIMSGDVPGVRLASITGSEVIAGSQIKQFIDANNNGEYSTDIYFANIDLDPVHDEHPGFIEGNGVSSSRIAGRFICSTVSCSSTTNFPVPGNPHGTWTAGIVFGDLRDAQDPNFPGSNTTAQIQRSGYAGEARGYLYQATSSERVRKAFDHVILRSPKPRVVSMAVGFPTLDSQCLGRTTLDIDANDLFENGILLIQSAGNSGNANLNDCTINPPAAAIGAFAVGGHGNSVTGTTADVRTGAIYSASSRGGTATEGGRRTIVDLTAFAWRSLVFDSSGGYSLTGFGTSISAPTVAGGAIDFIDFYKTFTGGDAKIDMPGILAANLLLQGDRQGQGGLSLSYFDNLWGAGRLRMRKFDTTGMDSPFYWETNHTCISNGEVFTITFNGGSALSTAVNDVKAVINWYDRRHELGQGLDDIDLRLKRTSNTLLVDSNSSFDEKERVYFGTAGGQALKLEIVGYDVGSDNEGCGTDANRVYWAFFFEDDARDDADGPSASAIVPE